MTHVKERADCIEGVVIGTLAGFDAAAKPLVRFTGVDGVERIAPALTLAHLEARDVGAEVALLFEAGDPRRPIVAGRLMVPRHADIDARVGERLELTAAEEVTLRCGKASITLTSSGKVLIRGTYVLSRSSGVSKIKGGSVQLN